MISTASAVELNETNDEILEINEIPIDEKELAIDQSDSIATNHTPSNYNEIQNSIENSEEGDTIILDGYYLFENTVTVNKTVTFQGINDATVDGDSKVRLFTVTANNVVFKNITFKNGYSDNGGAINGQCSAVNCTFVNNSVSGYAGALYALYLCDAIYCTFVNNSAKWGGGAVYGCDAVNCTFEDNSAESGGAMYYSGTALNCTFIGNYASNLGGALDATDAINCIFMNNFVNDSGRYGDWGGGAINRGSATNCTFINNSAKSYAGAIGYGSAVKCIFINNSAGYGGALNHGNAINCTFINNNAGSASALRDCNAENCTFINNNEFAVKFADVDNGFIKNCTFINNANGVRYVGGPTSNRVYAYNSTFINTSGTAVQNINPVDCIFINNSVGLNGGAAENCMFISNFKYAMTGDSSSAINCTFVNNTGGAIFTAKSVVNCTFINNSAEKGGAITGVDSIVNCTFINNSASDGGAVFGYYLYTLYHYTTNHNSVIKNCIFINNSASNGGAVSQAATIINCTFIDNSATLGGAIYSRYRNYTYTGYDGHYIGYYTTYYSQVENCTFISNSASNGGAMYDGNTINCTFKNNEATVDGGAIYLNNTMNITQCEFIDCFARNQAGAIYWNQSANITYCEFINCNSQEDKTSLAGNSSENDYLVQDCIFDKYPTNINYHYETSLIVHNLTYFNGEEGLLTVNLSDIRGALTNQIVFITFNGKKYNSTTGLDGVAFFNIENFISKAGIYNSTVLFEGDTIINPSSQNITITINKHESILNVPELLLYKNEYGILIGNLNNIRGPLSNKNIIFTLNGVDYRRTTNQNGVVEFNVLNYLTGKGKFDLNVTFEGDDYNHPCLTNVSVYIIDYRGILTCEVDGKYFNDTILKFSLINYKNKKPISNAVITVEFYQNEKVFETINLTTDVDGNANYRMPFDPGTYDFTAAINQEYTDVNNISINQIEINKIFGEISHQLLNGNKTLMIKLFNSHNLDVFRNIKINLEFNNGETAEIVTNDEGIALYDIPFPKGTYSVSINVDEYFKSFDPNPDYISNIVVTNDLNCSVNFTNNITFDFGQYGSTNYTIDGGYIDFSHVSVVDHPEAIISVDNNTITVFGLAVGKYTLLVETVPDDYHNPVTRTLNITVNSVKSKVSFSTGVSFEYGGSASLIVKVDGGTVNSKSIQILGHPEAKLTFAKNMITVSGLNPGKYTLRVESIPDKDHKAGEGTVDITVRKATAVIKASKITVALKKGTLWTVKLIDSKSKKPISNMKVTLKVYTGKKFKTVELKTNSKGEANYQTKKLSKGNHKVVVSSNHVGYNLDDFTSSIKVIKPNALKFKLKKNNPTKKATLISFQILDKKTKKGINGVKVKVMIYTGKKYKTFTLKSKKVSNVKGIIGFTTNEFSAGKHKVVIEPVSMKYSGSGKTTMVIKKSAKKYPKKTFKV